MRSGVTNVIRVLICDDHALVRAGVRRLLETMDGVEVVGESGSADDVVMRARQTLPDIVVLDLSLKGRSGFDALTELRLAVPETQAVILSMHEDVLHVREALSRGALCYVVKDAQPAELEIALRAAVNGRTFLSPQVSAPQLRSYRAERAPGDVENLPRRQREILNALGAGRSTKQIAADLAISIKTVETHRSRMMEALGCRNAGELLRIAMRHHDRP